MSCDMACPIAVPIVPEEGATVVTGKGDGRTFAAVGNALQQLKGQGLIREYEAHRSRAAYTFHIIPADS